MARGTALERGAYIPIVVHCISLCLGAASAIGLPYVFRELETEGDIYFSIRDIDLQHPYREVKIPYIVVWAFSIIIPMLIMCLLEIFRHFAFGREFSSWKRVWCHFYCMCMGLFICQLITEAIKSNFRMPRPDMVSRCDLATTTGSHWVTTDLCKQDGENLANGLRSFPSGHTSQSTCGAVFIVLYIWDSFSMRNRKGGAGHAVFEDGTMVRPEGAKRLVFGTHFAPHWWEWLFLIAPLYWPVLVGGQKLQEGKHFLIDVLAGAAIGTACAYAAYSTIPIQWKVRHQRYTARAVVPPSPVPPPLVHPPPQHQAHTHQRLHTPGTQSPGPSVGLGGGLSPACFEVPLTAVNTLGSSSAPVTPNHPAEEPKLERLRQGSGEYSKEVC